MLAVAVYLVLVVLAQLVLPAINEVPENFSATVLWSFRMASVGMQLILWLGLGLGFGFLMERFLGTTARTRSPGLAVG